MLIRTGVYPPETRSINLDSDWVYRRVLPAAYNRGVAVLARVRRRLVDRTMKDVTRFLEGVYRHHGPQGVFARTWPTGSTVLWVALILGTFLVVYYL